MEPPITDTPTSRQPLYNGHWLWHQMKLLQNYSGRFLILDTSGQLSCVLTTDQLCTTVPLYNGQTGNHTYLSCRNPILQEHENFNIEL